MRDAISVANAETLHLSCAVLSSEMLLSEQNYELVVCAAAMACSGRLTSTVPLSIETLKAKLGVIRTRARATELADSKTLAKGQNRQPQPRSDRPSAFTAFTHL